jgi:transitional endoplasmic reticulum ATPase
MTGENSTKEKRIELQIAESLQEDIGKKIARISSEKIEELGLVSGDLIEIQGKKSVIAKAMRDLTKKENSLIRINGTIRQNLGNSIVDKVFVKPVKVENAKSVTLSPTQEGIRFSNDPTEYFHTKLLHQPISQGEKIVIDVFGTRLTYIF